MSDPSEVDLSCYVKGISDRVTKELLEELFSCVGPVYKVVLKVAIIVCLFRLADSSCCRIFNYTLFCR